MCNTRGIFGNGYGKRLLLWPMFSITMSCSRRNWKQVLRSGESTHIRSLWTGSYFRLDTVMWVENVGSLLCSEWSFLIVLWFYPLTKIF